jgi:UDP-N-acetylmuramate dehydrogenase
VKISSQLESILDRLESIVERDVSFAPMCTYRVGGSVAGMIDVDDIRTLERIRSVLVEFDEVIPFLVVGRGSNLLVSDRGFPGVVLRLTSAFEQIEIDQRQGTVVAGGAALLPVVARKTAAAGLSGFEWAVGVPGSIGGAVRMNAGGHGSDMAASLTRVDTFDLLEGGPRQRTVDELKLGYRRSAIGPAEIVLWAELRLSPGSREVSEAEISEIVRWRREHQPGGQNAGSVFANPTGDSAGRLIDAAGLKGFRLGTAAVSEKHANFIQADPDGRADDVFHLIREVQRRVSDTFGIELRTENVLVGFEEGTRSTQGDERDAGTAGGGRR